MTIIIFWYWWALAVILLILELLISGFFFLWLSVAAVLTGVILWLIPTLSTDIQLFIFSFIAVLAIILWRVISKKTKPLQTDHPLLNKRGHQYVGQVFNLYSPIINGRGKIKVGDSLWTVCGEDCALGNRVKIIAVQCTEFKVKCVTQEND